LDIDLGNEGNSHATRTIYKAFLARWVRPAWGSLNIRGVRTTAVEHWLRQLIRADGSPMAPPTKAKIRNLMSTLFNHAIRYEMLEQGRNPLQRATLTAAYYGSVTDRQQIYEFVNSTASNESTSGFGRPARRAFLPFRHQANGKPRSERALIHLGFWRTNGGASWRERVITYGTSECPRHTTAIRGGFGVQKKRIHASSSSKVHALLTFS
jgi:hypothetical protein